MEKEDKKKTYEKDITKVDKIFIELEEAVGGITREVENRLEMVESFVKDEVKIAKDIVKKHK